MRPSDVQRSSLDLLRAVAVSLVIVNHALWTLGRDAGRAQSLGRLGVFFFFVHTSFVLMMSLDRMRAESADGIWARFMVRRCFRIYPLALLVITVVALGHIPNRLGGGIFHFQPFSMSGLVSNYLLIMNFTGSGNFVLPMWSLAYEMEMYVVLPALFALMLRNRSVRPWLSAWVLAAALAFLRHRLALPEVLNFLDYIPLFMAGVLAYRVLPTSTRRLPFWLWGVALGAAIVVYTLSPLRFGWRIAYPLTLAIGLLVPLVKETRVPTVAWVSHTIAKYSYGVYLAHMICFWVGFSFFHSRLLQFTVSAGLIVAVPYLLYHAVEAPMIHLGRRLSEAPWRQRAPEPVPSEI